MTRAHIIGAGLSGLASAVELTARGMDVIVYEAANEAGGRCRTFHDAALDCLIDNGNHLLLSGNLSAMDFLAQIDASNELIGPPEARFNFVDIGTNERWCVRPNKGPFPWWIFSPSRRVAGTRASDYFSGRKLLSARPDDRFADLISPEGALYNRFWDPLVVGALNIDPRDAAAILLKPVLLETFAKGADACRPLIARTGLGHTFIAPALDYLTKNGADIRYSSRIKKIAVEDNMVINLEGSHETLGSDDIVISAVPWWIAERILPNFDGPTAVEPILNVHYRLDTPLSGYETDPVMGVIGGLAQWLFIRDDVVSVTVSAAGKHTSAENENTAKMIWNDVCTALDLAEMTLPKWRVIKEHRATFRQTPQEIAKRPNATTKTRNLYLAGDWTNTTLPATIEGSLRSGKIAASLAFASVS